MPRLDRVKRDAAGCCGTQYSVPWLGTVHLSCPKCINFRYCTVRRKNCWWWLNWIWMESGGWWHGVSSPHQCPYLTWRHHYQQSHTLMVQCHCHSLRWNWKLINPTPVQKHVYLFSPGKLYKCEVCRVVSKLPVVITSPAAAQQQPTLVPAPGSGSSLISDHTTRGLGTPSTRHYVLHHQVLTPAAELCPSVPWLSDASTPPSTGPSLANPHEIVN